MIVILIILTIFGLSLGSFINALVWRLKERSKRPKDKKLSIINGRSMCPHCAHQLSAKDLIPVFSWLILGGKCRYCGKPISLQYPIVELLTAGLFIVSYVFWPASIENQQIAIFVLWLVFLCGFIALAIYDLKWYILPNQIIYLLIFLATAQTVFLAIANSSANIISQSFWGLVIGGGLFYVLFQISKGNWIGGGDVKLGALCGTILGGPANSLLMIFSASLFGSLVSIPLVVAGKAKRSTKVPFGPFLILATIVVRLFGASVIAWYKRKLLLA